MISGSSPSAKRVIASVTVTVQIAFASASSAVRVVFSRRTEPLAAPERMRDVMRASTRWTDSSAKASSKAPGRTVNSWKALPVP